MFFSVWQVEEFDVVREIFLEDGLSCIGWFTTFVHYIFGGARFVPSNDIKLSKHAIIRYNML